MSAFDLLDRIALSAATTHGLRIGDARALVRLALADAARRHGISLDQAVRRLRYIPLAPRAVYD